MCEDDNCFRFVFSDGTKKNKIAYADVEKELTSICYFV